MLKRCVNLFLIVLIASVLIGITARGNAHVDLYTDNCSAGVDYFEFQLNISNTSTAGETLYINSPGVWRMTYAATILPSGTNTLNLTYVAGSADPLLSPLYTTPGSSYTLTYNSATRLMQCNFSNTILGNHTAATNAPLYPGQTINAGHFRLTITNTNWVSSQPVGLAWSGTSSGIVAYVDTNSVSTAFNSTATRSLNAMCVMTTLSPSGVDEISVENDLEVYPNPAIGVLKFQSHTSLGTVSLQTMSGSIVAEKLFTGTCGEFDIQDLAKGVYVLYATGSEGRISKRIIIE